MKEYKYTAIIEKIVEGEIKAASKAEARKRILNGEGYDDERTCCETYKSVDSLDEIR